MTGAQHLEAMKADLAFKRKELPAISDRHDKQKIMDDITILQRDIKLAEWEAKQEIIRACTGKFKCGDG